MRIAYADPPRLHRHNFVPCARFPHLAVCVGDGCQAMGRWSYALGQFVHIIPASHDGRAGDPQVWNRRQRERPRT